MQHISENLNPRRLKVCIINRWVARMLLNIHTRSAMKGARMEPTRPVAEATPTPSARSESGYSSAVYTYATANAAEAPNFPSSASAVVSHSSSADIVHRVSCSAVCGRPTDNLAQPSSDNYPTINSKTLHRNTKAFTSNKSAQRIV